MITDQKLKEALRILTDHDDSFADAKSGYEFSKSMEKVVHSRLALQSNEGAQSAKDKWAYAHPDYVSALEQTKECGTLYTSLRSKREAAAAIIEAWRTEQSNMRAHTGASNVRRSA